MKHYIIALSITLSSVFAHNNNEEDKLSPLKAWKEQMYSVAMNDSDRNKDRQGIWFLAQLQRGDVQDSNTVLLPDLNLKLVNVRPLITERQNEKDGKKLSLSFKGLCSPIPQTIVVLLQQDGVTYLDLSYNNLTGTIPALLGDLNNLTDLDLGDNSLEGGIPKELGDLRKLRSLDLSYNNLNETIPAELGNLSKLHSLDLSYNHFTKEQIKASKHFLRHVENLDLTPQKEQPQ